MMAEVLLIWWAGLVSVGRPFERRQSQIALLGMAGDSASYNRHQQMIVGRKSYNFHFRLLAVTANILPARWETIQPGPVVENEINLLWLIFRFLFLDQIDQSSILPLSSFKFMFNISPQGSFLLFLFNLSMPNIAPSPPFIFFSFSLVGKSQCMLELTWNLMFTNKAIYELFRIRMCS